MIIRQYDNAAVVKETILAKDAPITWFDAVRQVFPGDLENKYCTQVCKVSDSVYELHFTGTCEYSIPVSGTQFISFYKVIYDLINVEKSYEIYYSGYAFNFPANCITDSKELKVMTSTKYLPNGSVDSMSLYYMRLGEEGAVEFQAMATEMGITGDVSAAHIIKADFDHNYQIVKTNTYVREL